MTDPTPVPDRVFWMRNMVAPLPALQGAINADVVVIGGGMMGLMCAHALAGADGGKICVLEAGTCGSGASGRSSGFITPDSELELVDLERHFGRDDGHRLWRFAWGGVEAIRSLVCSGEVACESMPQDALYVAAAPKAAGTIAKEHAARERVGDMSTLHGGDALMAVLGARGYHAGLQFGGTFGLDGFAFCIGLRDLLQRRGVRVFEHTPAINLSESGVNTPAGTVRAGHVIVCTDHLLPDLGLAKREIYHAQTFLAITHPLGSAALRRLFPRGPMMVWDTSLVYKYYRLTRENRLLVGGGTLASTYARRTKHEPAAVVRRLTRYLDRHFPGVHLTFAAAWPGLIGISKDFAPVVGRHARLPHVHFAGGAAGLPWAAALGTYLAERLLRGRSELDTVLSVERRFPVGRGLHGAIGTRAAFALSHGLMKFRP